MLGFNRLLLQKTLGDAWGYPFPKTKIKSKKCVSDIKEYVFP